MKTSEIEIGMKHWRDYCTAHYALASMNGVTSITLELFDEEGGWLGSAAVPPDEVSALITRALKSQQAKLAKAKAALEAMGIEVGPVPGEDDEDEESTP